MAYSAAGHGEGVCAGIAQYLDVPVKLIRILVVLSIFFGLAFFTTVAYIVLTFVLDQCRTMSQPVNSNRPAGNCWMPSTENSRPVKIVCGIWSVM